MLRSDEMVAAMEARGALVLAQAIATAPFDAKDKDGRHYVEDFSISSTKHGGVHNDRAACVVSNDNSAAFYVEFGNVNVDRHRTLGKALDAVHLA